MKHSFNKFHGPKSYLVICRTWKQAKDLWERLHRYWSKAMPNFRITASEVPLVVRCPCGGDNVRFISVHSASYIDVHKGFRGKTVYGDDVDKFLDEKEGTDDDNV